MGGLFVEYFSAEIYVQLRFESKVFPAVNYVDSCRQPEVLCLQTVLLMDDGLLGKDHHFRLHLLRLEELANTALDHLRADEVGQPRHTHQAFSPRYQREVAVHEVSTSLFRYLLSR